MQVALLTIPQKELITGQQFAPDSYFNPVQDANGDWIISTQEIAECTNTDFLFVKQLPLIEYQAPIINE